MEFEARFSSEEGCREYLISLRWPNGFQCSRCGHRKAWPAREVLLHCASCGYQGSVTAGTIFQDTHKPLMLWFRAMWWVTSQKTGTSALGLQRVLGLGSYKTAWMWLHKMSLLSRICGSIRVQVVRQAYDRERVLRLERSEIRTIFS